MTKTTDINPAGQLRPEIFDAAMTEIRDRLNKPMAIHPQGNDDFELELTLEGWIEWYRKQIIIEANTKPKPFNDYYTTT